MTKSKKIIFCLCFVILFTIINIRTYASQSSNNLPNETNSKNNVGGYLTIQNYTNNKLPLSGIKFKILNENKIVVNTLVTNEKGLAKSKQLPFGTYYFKQVEAPFNVDIDDTEYAFRISDDEQIIPKTVVNNLLTNRLILVVVTRRLTPLENATFNILDVHKNIVSTITTNNNGIAISDKLETGTYFYQEVNIPQGLVKDNNLYLFNIFPNDTEENVVKSVVKEYSKGYLKLTVTDENNNPIPNVVFDILDERKNVIDRITSDSDGIATSLKYLNLGTYYYQQIKVPNDIRIDTKEYKFSISKNEQILPKRVILETIQLPSNL